MVDEGHLVGNHTDTYPSLPDVSDEQIKKELQTVEESFEKVTGHKGMKYLRLPKGEYSEWTLALTRELGYHNIFWSLALVDWVRQIELIASDGTGVSLTFGNSSSKIRT